MYANLEVDYFDPANGVKRKVYAWAIDRSHPAGRLTISLDDNDGQSNYAVESGEVVIDAKDLISVAASY